MSVDGRIIADVHRLRQLHGASLFLLVVGGKGAGKTTALRAVEDGLATSGNAAEYDSVAGLLQCSDDVGGLGDPFTVCRLDYPGVAEAQFRNVEPSAFAPTLRRFSVLIADDIDLLWMLCRANRMLGPLQRVLDAALSSPACAVVASAASVDAVPPWLLTLKMPGTYPLRELTEAGVRRLLRAVPEPHFKAHGERLIDAQALATSRSMVLFNTCMTLHAAARGAGADELRRIAAEGTTFLHHQRSPTDAVGQRQRQRLYGLDDIHHRLRTLLSVFVSHSSAGGGGRLMSALPSSTGILLHGPSGCGKSSLAQQLEVDFPAVPFFFVECTMLFSKFLGESEEQLRENYRRARTRAPAVVVLEDIDVIAQSRGAMSRDGGSGGGGKGGLDVTKRMLAGLLCELDGVTDNSGVLTIGITNAPQVLDAAVLRQGRLETMVPIPPLTLSGAEAMCRDFFDRFDGGDELRQQCCATVAARAVGCSAASLQFFLRKVLESVVQQCGWPAAEASRLALPPVSDLHGLLFEHCAMMTQVNLTNFE